MNTLAERRATAPLLEAQRKMVEVLISRNEEPFEDVMSDAMWPLADAEDFDRVCVYKVVYVGGNTRIGQVYRWCREDGGTTPPNPDMLAMPDIGAVRNWIKTLSGGDCVCGPVCDMDTEERNFLENLGVRGILMVPIAVRGEFWGCVTLQNHVHSVQFGEACLDLLKTTARLIALAYIMAEAKREAADAHALSDAMFASAPIGLTLFDETGAILDCNEAVLRIYGAIDRQYYLDHFFDLSPERQPDGAISVEKDAKIMKRALAGERIVMEWMHQTPAGEPIPCEITVTRVLHKGRYIGLGYVYDLRRIDDLEKKVRRLSETSAMANIWKRAYETILKRETLTGRVPTK